MLYHPRVLGCAAEEANKGILLSAQLGSGGIQLEISHGDGVNYLRF